MFDGNGKTKLPGCHVTFHRHLLVCWAWLSFHSDPAGPRDEPESRISPSLAKFEPYKARSSQGLRRARSERLTTIKDELNSQRIQWQTYLREQVGHNIPVQSPKSGRKSTPRRRNHRTQDCPNRATRGCTLDNFFQRYRDVICHQHIGSVPS